ncbi:hypothetical protein JCM10212_005285 [Sporobolomyces blumeae]
MPRKLVFSSGDGDSDSDDPLASPPAPPLPRPAASSSTSTSTSTSTGPRPLSIGGGGGSRLGSPGASSSAASSVTLTNDATTTPLSTGSSTLAHETNGSGKKRKVAKELHHDFEHGTRSAPGSSASSGKAAKKPRLVGFHESDEEDEDEDARRTQSRDVSTTASGKKRVVLSNEEKKRLRLEAHRLEAGRKELPVWEGKDEILKAVEENDTVVVLGETGSGKTTQIPQFLMRSSVPCQAPRVVCTQPRRVAATSLAARVSTEVGCVLGSLVGYTVRFDDRSTAKTRLKYATDGALLAEMLSDRDLEQYDVVVLDEAHERSLRTDMLMGFLKDIQKRRKDKIVVMSATIDAKRFSDFFNSAPVLFIRGRQHKVTVHYSTEPLQDYLDASLKTVFQIHTTHPPGAILVFLPGQDEIESLAASIRQFLPDLPKSFPKADSILVTPLYAKLPAAEQARAFAPTPPNTRKIILATNVAETSVTLPGVKFVVDCGLAKEKRYHAGAGIDSLTVESISQSSAKQRAGRAGRESDGHCFRLYTEQAFFAMPHRTEPEIKRVSLTFALLHLLAAGQEDITKFEYMDPPERDAIMFALLTLHGLGAVSNKGKITPLGRQMAELPLDPIYARVLVASFSEGCPFEALNLVALLGSKDQLLAVSSANRDKATEARRKFVHRSGDHWTLLNMLEAFEEFDGPDRKEERKMWCREHFISLKAMLQVLDARKQLRERVERLKIGDWAQSCGDETEPVLNALVGGLFANTAIRNEDGSYRHTVTRQAIAIHPSSAMHNRKAPAIVYDELVLTTKTYARGVSEINPRSIQSKAPAVFASGREER